MIDTFFIDDKIKTRGEDYFNSGKVKLVFQGLNSFKIIVSGNQKYICELTLKDGKLISSRCTCPYLKGVCKHVAATIFFYNSLLTNQTPSSYTEVFNAINLKLQKQSLSNVNLEVAKSNLNFVFSNFTSLNDLEKAKILFVLLSNQIKYLEKQNVLPYYKIFVDYTTKQNFTQKIIDSLTNNILNNKIIFQDSIYDLLETFLSSNVFSSSTLSAIKNYIVSYGCDHFINRFISLALLKDLSLSEDLYSLIVSTPELIGHNIRNVINNCISSNYDAPLRKLSIAYRDILEKSALIRILNHFKNSGDFSSAKTLAEYLLKRFHTFDMYLEYRSICDEKSRLASLPQILTFAKKHKFDIAIKLYEGLDIKPGEILKLSNDDLFLLKDKIPSDLYDSVSITLSKRITVLFEKEEGLLAIKLLDLLYSFNQAFFKELLFSNEIASHISNSKYRASFLALLLKTDTINDFGIFHYEVN